jgi:pyruvate dehydrogenase E2 component (dihydrolipoamide acetyltransferase)
MIKEVRLPEISENVESGDVIKVLVAVGDTIAVDQPVVELETDKAVLEVPSPYAGTVTDVLVKNGETIAIDQAIIKVETDAAAAAEAPKEAAADKAAAEAPAKKAKPEPATKRDEPPSVEETDEEAEGAEEEEPEEVPERPARKEKPRPAAPPMAAAGAATSQSSERRSGADRRAAAASPTLRRLARELGVDLDNVTGSGPGGRILKDDLTTHARNVVAGASASVRRSTADEVTESTKWGPVVREPMSKVRQVTARTMGEAWTTIPHVTQFDKVDITEMEEIRKQYSKRLEATGGKLTMTAILLKVAASALKVFPQFNASIDMDKQEITYKRHYHIGVAVDTDRGLLVPVVRSVDKKNITELSHELNTLAERARSKKLTPEEMDGGTFTISNLGGIGGTNFSPIVYPPQVAIMGVSRARVEPVYTTNNQFEPRLMLPICVSYDHRIIDGADAARFLRWIVQALEEPLLMALEG